MVLTMDSSKKDRRLNLTEKEHAYLKHLEPVIICPDPDWPPFEYRDVHGQYAGIAADLTSLVFQSLSIEYRVLWTESWNKTLSLAREQRLHLIPFLNKTTQREEWLTFTEPLFIDPNVFVTRVHHPFIDNPFHLKNETIALPEGTAVEKFIKKSIPGLKIITGESELEALQMVADGSAQLTLRSLMVAAYTIGINNLHHLKISGHMPEITNYLCMGVVKKEPLLKNILNKAIATITPEDQVSIVHQYVNSKLKEARDFLSDEMMFFTTFLTSSNWYWNYQIQRNNERYRILMDHMWAHTWYLQDKSTYGLVNKYHAQFLGFEEQALSYKRIQDVLPEKVAQSQIAQNQRVFSEKVPLESEDWFVDGKGNQRLLHITRVPKMSTDQEVEYVVCTAIDITSRKEAENKLKEYTQEIERLYDNLNQEMDRAHRIHNTILPKELPSIEAISYHIYYQPSKRLGGDFYNVIQSDNKILFYLSDISGHSLDSAMVNFFVKEAINSYIALKPDEISPGRILRHLTKQYRCESYPEEMFICIFLSVLDLETMELTYIGAGFHDLPLVKLGDGEECMLSSKGLFINSAFSIESMNYQEESISLTPGSTIFFNTDGLTEQGKPGNYYRDRLSKIFYRNAHLLPTGISEAVIEDFKDFNNGSIQGKDDITFLILQVKPENKERHCL